MPSPSRPPPYEDPWKDDPDVAEEDWQASALFWVAAKELKLSYHNPETMLLTTYPYCGNLNQVP